MTNAVLDITSLDGIKVLIVECDAHNQQLASEYINRNHGISEIVDDGNRAINRLQQEKFDCVLMDLQMSNMDGYEVSGVIRQELNLHVPIIACSIHSLIGEKTHSAQVGMNGYLTKPFSESHLINLIHKCVSAEDDGKDDFDEIIADFIKDEGSEFVIGMLGLYLNKVEPDLTKLRKFIDAADYEAISRKAHSYKGSLGSLRFIHGYSIASKLEIECRTKNDEFCDKLGEQFLDYLKISFEEIKRITA